MALCFFLFADALNAHPQRGARGRHHHHNRHCRHESFRHRAAIPIPPFGLYQGNCGPRSRHMCRHHGGGSRRHRGHR